ncbi:MAG TPA: hypothetical protein VFI23_07715 [Rhizomicrobium sp.]|nr:hypothetical protein [Rhizomicrobium sp.]
MRSDAYEVTWTRLQGATLALLVQAALIAGAILSLTKPIILPRVLQHEATLWLRPLLHVVPAIVPRTIDARGRHASPIHAPLPAFVPPNGSAASPAPPSDLSALGRAVFGCAPEHYAELSPEDRAHCPKPGEGLASQPPDLMGGPSHVKDNVRWANALAHKQSPLELPGGLLFPLVALGAVLDGSISERSSAFRDPEKWPTYTDAGKLMPRDLHDQERTYDAWHRDHPVK